MILRNNLVSVFAVKLGICILLRTCHHNVSHQLNSSQVLSSTAATSAITALSPGGVLMQAGTQQAINRKLSLNYINITFWKSWWPWEPEALLTCVKQLNCCWATRWTLSCLGYCLHLLYGNMEVGIIHGKIDRLISFSKVCEVSTEPLIWCCIHLNLVNIIVLSESFIWIFGLALILFQRWYPLMFKESWSIST